MFYETDYRNTRTARIAAVVLVLMGIAFLLGFLFMSSDWNFSEGLMDIDWSLVVLFIPIFGGSFASIIAAISAQKQKQGSYSEIQNPYGRSEIEEKAQELIYKQVNTVRKPPVVYCNYCGEKLEREALFCPQCGTKTRP